MKGRKKQPQILQHTHFPSELCNEIFLRSPLKTILRFRGVCKSWCSLIDSADFISTHLKIHSNNRHITYLLSTEHVPNTLFDSNFIIRRGDVTTRKIGQLVKFTQSVSFLLSNMINGLLLVEISDYNLISHEYRLWNPSIRKYVIIPPCPIKCVGKKIKLYHLGFAPSSNDYKVVVLKLGDFVGSSGLFTPIAIYSLCDHVWRVKPTWVDIPRWCFAIIQARLGVVYSQGVVYWRPYHQRYPKLIEDTSLLSFDFDTEEFRYLEFPDVDGEMLRFIFCLGGSLAVLGISCERVCVWVMEKDNAGNEPWRLWSSGVSDLAVYEFLDRCTISNLQIVYVENANTLLLHEFNKLMLYNVASHRMLQMKYFRCSNLDTYVESLVLHKGYEGATLNSLT